MINISQAALLATNEAQSNPGAASARRDAGQLSNSEFVNKETFLKLLVTQIRHQNPLDPVDPTQFVTQLAQLSELEQLMNIHDLLEQRLGIPSQDQQPDAGVTDAGSKD